MQFAEIIEHWTGWCPRKQKIQMASRACFLSEEKKHGISEKNDKQDKRHGGNCIGSCRSIGGNAT